MNYANAKYALLVVDMQNDYALQSSSNYTKWTHEVIPFVKNAIDFFRKNNMPIIYVVRSYRKDWVDIEKVRSDLFKSKNYLVQWTKWCEVVDDIKPQEDDYIVIKNRFSGFMNTELDLILRRLNIKKIAICWTQYPNCIRTTAYDWLALDYDVTILTDATAAKSEEVKKANIFDLMNAWAECVIVEEFKNNN